MVVCGGASSGEATSADKAHLQALSFVSLRASDGQNRKLRFGPSRRELNFRVADNLLTTLPLFVKAVF